MEVRTDSSNRRERCSYGSRRWSTICSLNSSYCQDRHRDTQPLQSTDPQWPLRCRRRASSQRCVGCAAKASYRCLDVAEGDTAGNVGQEAIKGITNAGASSTQPVVTGFARCASASAGRSDPTDVAPIGVALEPEDPLAQLSIVADRAAGQTARDIE